MAYYTLGVAFYTQVEGWSWNAVIYFLIVSGSTVGYGDLVPSSDGSKMVTVLFISIGILVTYANIVVIAIKVFQPFYDAASDRFERVFPQTSVDIDGDGRADFKIPRGPFLDYSKQLALPAAIMLCVQLVFVYFFCVLEAWSFVDSVWHCFVTSVTVGYGSPTVSTSGGRWLAILHICVSVSTVGALFTQASEFRGKRAAKLHKACPCPCCVLAALAPWCFGASHALHARVHAVRVYLHASRVPAR